jgi:hypothetical protein
MRIQALGLHVALGSNHKEGCGLMECIKTLKIEVTAIHHVEGSGFCHQNIEDIDIVDFAVGKLDESRNGTSPV